MLLLLLALGFSSFCPQGAVPCKHISARYLAGLVRMAGIAGLRVTAVGSTGKRSRLLGITGWHAEECVVGCSLQLHCSCRRVLRLVGASRPCLLALHATAAAAHGALAAAAS